MVCCDCEAARAVSPHGAPLHMTSGQANQPDCQARQGGKQGTEVHDVPVSTPIATCVMLQREKERRARHKSSEQNKKKVLSLLLCVHVQCLLWYLAVGGYSGHRVSTTFHDQCSCGTRQEHGKKVLTSESRLCTPFARGLDRCARRSTKKKAKLNFVRIERRRYDKSLMRMRVSMPGCHNASFAAAGARTTTRWQKMSVC